MVDELRIVNSFIFEEEKRERKGLENGLSSGSWVEGF